MILAVDTSTKWTGIALHDGRTIVAESGWYSSNNQTIELAPAVSQMLNRAGISLAELSAIAVATGPGSYTGLRIGLGFCKGLALANKTKLIGVPTLDILAASMPPSDKQLVVIAEAGRSRICSAAYQWVAGKGWQGLGEPIISDLPALLAEIEEPAILAGEISAASTKLIRSSKKDLKVAAPAAVVRRAGYLAEIGWQRLKRGWTDDPGELAPLYLRDPAGAVPAEK